ncbi:MAG TPA: iron-sulfur cluster carrier protein ApbC [Steroidobacteraceae bacterium]|nr:iron-sulfur cluster carrier protein ApbC [Steroidobacteraceae bacterium]
MTESQILATARAVIDEQVEDSTGRKLGELQAVTRLGLAGDRLQLNLRLPVPTGGLEADLLPALQQALQGAGLAQPLELLLESRILPRAVQKPLKPLPAIANLVAVGSAKGGVGKSTVAANLALAWVAQGARVGLLDADVYGPSQPLLLGVTAIRPETTAEKRILPVQVHGLKMMSIGLLIDAEQPAIWRGPMVTQALMQLLTGTEWGELDYLVVDLPPGTGDLQLTLAQKVPVAGAVVITTPQQLAVADARKGLRMFEKVGVPVLGVVENMSTHVCTRCGHEESIFGHGGGAALARECGTELLAQLPLDPQIGVESDQGRPSVLAAPDSPRARAYFQLARRTAGALARRPRDRSSAFPGIVVERSS